MGLYLFRAFPLLSCAVTRSLICRGGSSANFAVLPVVFFPPLCSWCGRHLLLLVTAAALCLAASPSPPSPYPSSPRLLPQLPLVWMISPLLKWAGTLGLWGQFTARGGGDYSALSTQREAVLWRAEGCFWTSRFREITEQSSDWQATDCMCLGGSCLMGADGFRWSRRPAGCMCADRMASGPRNAVLQCCALIVLYFSFAVLGIKLRSVICQRCFCLRMPVWVSAPATTIQSVIWGGKKKIRFMKENTSTPSFIRKSNLAGIHQTRAPLTSLCTSVQ